MNTVILKAKGVKEITRQEIMSYVPPIATESYCPISNKQIIQTILEQLDRNRLTLRGEFHKRDGSRNKFVGGFVIHSDNKEMNLFLGYKNSYDKSMTAAFALGTRIMICSNSVVTGEISMIRKHTGRADEIIINALSAGILRLNDGFIETLDEQFSRMKEIKIDKRISSELAGRLYIEEKIITSHQLSIFKKEIENESYDYGVQDTLYNLYQATTHSLKSSHPTTWMNNHLKAHKFFTEVAGIIHSEPKITVPVSPIVAPNQLSPNFID
jgi:hypothetical protein